VWGDYPLAVRSFFFENLTNGTSPKAQANKLPPSSPLSVTHAEIAATAAGSRENSLDVNGGRKLHICGG